MKPKFRSGDTAFVAAGHPSFRVGDPILVTTFTRRQDGGVYYRIKDTRGEWHLLAEWQLAPLPPPEETDRWEFDRAGRFFVCSVCERVSPSRDWFLAAGHCPYCCAADKGRHDWLLLRQDNPDLPACPPAGKVYRFHPAPDLCADEIYREEGLCDDFCHDVPN